MGMPMVRGHEHSKREVKAERGIGLLVDALFCGAVRVRQDEEFCVASVSSWEAGCLQFEPTGMSDRHATGQDDEA